MLEARDLTCIRNDNILFEQLNFSLQAGQILQLLGHNGAGKSSLMRLLAGLASPAQGDVLWHAQPIARQRLAYQRDLLFIGHKAGINASLTPLENLRFAQQLSGAPGCDLWALLAGLGLGGHEDVPCGSLSAGQQRRVNLARLWLSESRLWLLDEPFTSLDKSAIAGLQARFAQHLEQGGLIVVASHQDLHSALPVQTLNLADPALRSVA